MPALSLRATYLIIIPTNLRRDIIPTIWIYRPHFHSTGLEKGLRSRFGSFPSFFFLSLSFVLCTNYFIRSICLCFRRINKNSRMIPTALFYPVKIENLRILCFLNDRYCLFGIRNYEKWSRVASILLVRLVGFIYVMLF